MFKSLNDSGSPPFRNIFERLDHGMKTGGNGSCLKLPKVKIEAERLPSKALLIITGLPPDLINESYLVNLKRKIDILSFTR